jgi:hypothetical protein
MPSISIAGANEAVNIMTMVAAPAITAALRAAVIFRDMHIRIMTVRQFICPPRTGARNPLEVIIILVCFYVSF